MPFVPTKWNDLPAELKDLFSEVSCWNGSKLSVILREAIRKAGIFPYNPAGLAAFVLHCHNNWGMTTNDDQLISSCWDFVNYQLNASNTCKGSYSDFWREGFQIGSAWHGDVLQAPVLFLSSNPGITQRCLFPRWHPDRSLFTMGGLDASGNELYTINYTDDSGTQHTLKNQIAGIEEIYNFLRDRLFETTCVKPSGAPDAWLIGSNNNCVPKNGVNTKSGVDNWEGIRDAMHLLLGFPDGMIPQTKIAHTRKLMRSVLSAEVIFFGSQDEYGAGDKDTLDYFWKKYVLPLLNNCAAKILFLCGGKVIDTFNRHMKPMKLSLKSGKIGSANTTYAGKRVAAIHNLSWRYGKRNYPDVIAALRREAFHNPGGITDQAIREAKRLYML